MLFVNNIFTNNIFTNNIFTNNIFMKTIFHYRSLAVLLIAVSYWTTSFAQLQVIPGGTGAYSPPTNLVSNVLLGQGVVLVGTPVYSGDPAAVGYFDGSASNVGLASGVVMTTGSALNAIGPNNVAQKYIFFFLFFF